MVDLLNGLFSGSYGGKRVGDIIGIRYGQIDDIWITLLVTKIGNNLPLISNHVKKEFDPFRTRK